MRSLNGFRLAVFAAFVVLITWRLYRPAMPQAAPYLHKGAMAGAAILSVLALFSAPGLLGGLVALVTLLAAAGFLLTR